MPTEEECKKSIYFANSSYYAGIEEVGSGEWSEGIIGKTGIYEAPDGMYGGTSYYYRGAVENNYLTFAGYCWRIVRINGDGTIRLIYAGTTCHKNGTTGVNNSVEDSLYNRLHNRSEYVGWTYKEGYQRPSDTIEGKEIDSNAKTITEEWYNANIGKNPIYASYVVDTKFCNDREVAEGYTWESQPSNEFHYAAYKRLLDSKPTFNCSNKNDIYTSKVSLLTLDEAMYAGGGANNNSYYLYSGSFYLMASPSSWDGTSAKVFEVENNGSLNNVFVNTYSFYRPVISLKSENVNITGSGLINDPYTISNN